MLVFARLTSQKTKNALRRWTASAPDPLAFSLVFSLSRATALL